MISDILNTIIANVLCYDITQIAKLNLICKNMYDSVHNYLSILDNKNNIYHKICILKKCIDDPDKCIDKAIKYNYIDIIQFIVSNSYLTRDNISEYFVYFSRNNNIDFVKIIFNNTIIKKTAMYNALLNAGIRGNTDIVHFLIENNKHCMSQSQICSLIAEASANNKPDFLYLLLEKYGDNNITRAKIMHAISCACRHNRMDIIQLMIDKNLNIELCHWNIGLNIAASSNCDSAINIVKFLIKKGALSDLNDYYCAMYHAIKNNNINIVKLIIQTFLINIKQPISNWWEGCS
jgi:hypothetical protein